MKKIMKKNGRKSKNVEVQTEKQSKAALKGLELQDMAYNNETLKDPVRVKNMKISEEGKAMMEVTNPGRINSAIANNPHMAGRAIKSPAERRGIKDPKPGKFKKNSDFKFFTHSTKGK